MGLIASAIYGGAGTILKEDMPPVKEEQYKKVLAESLNIGYDVLKAGGSALEAVEKAVIVLEDSPLFNAGKGSVFTHKKEHEMDAAIMCGKTLEAGAVAGIQRVKNPIVLASQIMMHSDHVFLMGEGALEFAREQKLSLENEEYYFDAYRYEQWEQAQKTNKASLDHSKKENKEHKFGTVGAVALDGAGNLAAATSTGGLTNKKYSRVGDSPIIGAGTYANNNTCAISCTGDGEYFIRAVTAYDVSCLMEYKGCSLEEACRIVVQEKMVKIGGEGGLIAIDRAGNIDLPFNSDGMYRASRRNDEPPLIRIYKD